MRLCERGCRRRVCWIEVLFVGLLLMSRKGVSGAINHPSNAILLDTDTRSFPVLDPRKIIVSCLLKLSGSTICTNFYFGLR